MRNFLLQILFFLFLSGGLFAQDIYVVSSSGAIYKVDYKTCTSTFVVNTGTILNDIAICPGNPTIIYGVDGSGNIYTTDIVSGITTIISTSPYGGFLNALVCDGNGHLITADYSSSGLYQYDIAGNSWSQLGTLTGYTSGGDLTFYNGQLYWATSSNQVISINLSPFSFQLVSTMNVPNIFGILTVSSASFCDSTVTTTMIASSGPDIYSLDPNTGVCTPKCMGAIPGDIYGAASVDVPTNPTQPVLTVNTPNPICPGKNVTLTVSGASSYVWNPGNVTGSSITVNPTVATTYTVTGTDQNNCTVTTTTIVTVNTIPTGSPTSTPAACTSNNGTASANASGNSPYTYSWSPTGGTTANPTGLAAGTYTVNITDKNGCTNTASVSISTTGSLSVTPNIPDTICPGANVNASITATGVAPYTYSWSTGATSSSISITPASTSIYTVTVSDAAGCSNSQTITVPVNSIPLVYSLSKPNEICNGDNISLSIQVSSGNKPYTYTWSPGGATTSPISITPTQSGYYTVNIIDGCGVTKKDSIPYVVNPNPVPAFGDTSIITCDNACYDFTDQTTLSSGSISAWHWDYGNTNSTSDTANTANGSYCYTQSGTYTIALDVITDKGCRGQITKPVTVSISGNPTAEFTASPTTTDINNPFISFTDQSTGASLYSWDFGDPYDVSTSTIQNPNHTYSDTGTYCIQLTVTNSLGCTADVVHCITITPDWTFYIPNCFTPNGDGKNDDFNGKGTNIKEYEMWIYDRWGNEIFYTNSLSKNWNWKVLDGGSNDIAQIDTYVWVVKLKDVFTKYHHYVGHVSIVK